MKGKYGTVSLPMGIVREIDRLIEELGYWPSRGAFVREACLQKVREEWLRLREPRVAQSMRSPEPRLGTNPGDRPP